MKRPSLDLLQPVDDRDCSFVLLMPPAEQDGAGAAAAPAPAPAADREGEHAAKRQRTEDGAAADIGDPLLVTVEQQPEQQQQQAEAQQPPQHQKQPQHAKEAQERRVALPACSLVLRMYSLKFKRVWDWAARWAQGGAKEYVVQCRDDAEVAGYRQLVDFMHSMGRQLPADPAELLQLLLLAREHVVEVAVLSCIHALLEQGPSLPAAACMQVLPALDTGVSGDADIQAAADMLAGACCDRLGVLLAAEGALQGPEEQRLLLQLLGPWQEMLNDKRLRDLFLKLPFGVLRDCLLEDANISADTETTDAPVQCWLPPCCEEHSRGMSDSQFDELFSRIRFPAVPAAVLLDYHRCFATLRRFDPEKQLLCRAFTDPAIWDELQEAMMAADPEPAVAELKKKCGRWWLEREPTLPGCPAPLEFSFQVSYAISLSRGASEDKTVCGTKTFTPSSQEGWGSEVTDGGAEGRPPLSWEAFWGEGSPYCRDGAVRGRLTLSLPEGS
ncbi:hypothetical protein ABPG75_000770 [Micractinium tetrahymenae]